MVRNSVGANCYVADEIITSRAGVRIRVGNTDAEGRMAMVDVLCRFGNREDMNQSVKANMCSAGPRSSPWLTQTPSFSPWPP